MGVMVLLNRIVKSVLCALLLLCLSVCSAMQSLAFSDDDLNQWLSEVQGKDYNLISSPTTEQPKTPSGAGGSVVRAAAAINSQFDINQVPWSSFPQNVRNILYIDINKAYSDFLSSPASPTPLNLPFCLIRVGSSNYQVWVCQNAFPAYFMKNGTNVASSSGIRLVGIVPDSEHTSQWFGPIFVYSATYKVSDNSLVTDWHEISPTKWSDYPNVRIDTYGTLSSSSTARDFYYYGAADPRRRADLLELSSQGIILNATTNNTGALYYRRGIYSSSIIPPLLKEPYNNGSTATFFSLPSPEAEAENTRKGIWETIKSLPSMFLDMLKSFFIPKSDFFSNWYNSLDDYFSNHLGFVWQVISLPIDVINTVKESVQDGNGSAVFTFPEIKVPKFGSTGYWKISSSQSINLQTVIESSDHLHALWQTFQILVQASIWSSLCVYGYKVIRNLLDKE